jgi:hypothetical protein
MPVIVLGILLLLVVGVTGTLFLTPVGAILPGKRATSTPGTNRGGQSTSTPGAQASPENTRSTSTPGSSYQTLPAVQTSCPATNTARPAVMPALTLGHDPTIIYIVNEGTASAPTFGTVKAYNTVTQQKTELAKNKRKSSVRWALSPYNQQ